jgi:hypothetical protein
MYACIARNSKLGKAMAFRDTLPLYDINSEFYKQILAFDALYAATLPPPPPKLVRQNAEEPRYLQLVAMEEGRPIAPYAPIKKAETSPAVTSEAVTSEATAKPKKVRFIEPRRLEYESDDDPDDDMYV